MSNLNNHYIKQARDLINAGVTQLEASEKNLVLLATAMRAADKGDIAASRTFMAILGRN